MRTIELISVEEIEAADFVTAVDEENGYSAQVWGDDVLMPLSTPVAQSHEINSIEIACGKDDCETLEKIVAMVKSAHGAVSSLMPNPPRMTPPDMPVVP